MNAHPPLRPGDDEPSFDDPGEARLHRKRRLALAYRLFGAMHWGEQGDGHISARDPERTDCFWLLDYGVPFSEATVDALVLVGPDGSVVAGDGEINPTAYYIHMPIHEARPEIVCAAAHPHRLRHALVGERDTVQDDLSGGRRVPRRSRRLPRR